MEQEHSSRRGVAKSKALKSVVWKYFVTVGDMKCRCNVCHTVLTYRDSSTSGMRHHVKCKHPEIYDFDFASNTPASSPSTGTVQYRDGHQPQHAAAGHSASKLLRGTSAGGVEWSPQNHSKTLKLKRKRVPQKDKETRRREADVTCAGRAFLCALFGAANYREWMVVKRKSEHPDHHTFVRWLLTLAKSALDNVQENDSGSDGSDSTCSDEVNRISAQNALHTFQKASPSRIGSSNINGSPLRTRPALEVKVEPDGDGTYDDGVCLDLDAVEDPPQ